MNVVVHGGDLPGLRQLAQMLEDANRQVSVGFPESAKEDDGTSVAIIAAVHEFGSPENNIPERSFIRAGIRRAKPKLDQVNIMNLRKVLAGQQTITGALEQLGAVASGEVKREINVGTFAPNKPLTIARKGSSKPLIDTGQMRQSITWKVGPPPDQSRVIK